MFWKKKKTIEVALDSRHSDNRAAYRIAPDSDRPVIISIKDEDFSALNISGTGIAFRADRFEVGSRHAAKIRLPDKGKVFPVILEVVAKQKDLCRCCFRDIHQEAENLLHSYILELQKSKIRQNHGQV